MKAKTKKNTVKTAFEDLMYLKGMDFYGTAYDHFDRDAEATADYCRKVLEAVISNEGEPQSGGVPIGPFDQDGISAPDVNGAVRIKAVEDLLKSVGFDLTPKFFYDRVLNSGVKLTADQALNISRNVAGSVVVALLGSAFIPKAHTWSEKETTHWLTRRVQSQFAQGPRLPGNVSVVQNKSVQQIVAHVSKTIDSIRRNMLPMNESLRKAFNFD